MWPRSGELDEGELLRAMVHSLNLRGQRDQVRATAELVRSLLAACDLTGSGSITFQEFMAPDVGLGDVVVSNFGFFNSKQPPAQ